MHIDYITATSKEERDFEACKRACEELAAEAQKQEFYGFLGFREDFGDKGSRFVGVRGTDGFCMISCSGLAAHEESIVLRRIPAWRPSRVDIALDVRKPFDVVQGFLQWQGKARTKISAIGNETLYVGSRKSTVFWRIYDKATEIGRPELKPLWRFELELKGERAKQFWHSWSKPLADLHPIFAAYLRDAKGSPREPAYSLVSPFLEARDRWNLEPLPRRRRAGETYLWQNVLPFLRENWDWAGPIVVKQLMKEG